MILKLASMSLVCLIAKLKAKFHRGLEQGSRFNSSWWCCIFLVYDYFRYKFTFLSRFLEF